MADRCIDRARRDFLARAGWFTLAPVAGSSIAAFAKSATASQVVTIEAMQFNPPVLTVKKGERVQFVNKDPFPHTATAADKSFESGEIAANAAWAFRPQKAGEFTYSCRLHPTMKARLVVTS